MQSVLIYQIIFLGAAIVAVLMWWNLVIVFLYIPKQVTIISEINVIKFHLMYLTICNIIVKLFSLLLFAQFLRSSY